MSAQELVQLHYQSGIVDVNETEERDSTAEAPQQPVTRLLELTRQILQEVSDLALVTGDAVGGVESLSFSEGVDFYQEVEKFEIRLIVSVLQRTHGNQRQAAKFLGLKATTLNTKIKQYCIRPMSFETYASQ